MGKELPMAGVSELEEYVGRLSQGARLESAGQFTVDLIKEARQMRALARSHPNRWAFYLTQAAVAGGAVSVQMSSGVRAESVTLEFLEGHSELDSPARLTEPSPDESVFLQLLRQALRWALASEAAVDLLVEGPEVGFGLSGRKGHIQLLETASQPETRVALMRRRPAAPWWKWSFGGARASLALFLEARWRLAYCPIPVKFDGLSLCAGVPESLPEFRAPVMMQQLHLALEGGSALAVAHPGMVPAYQYISGDQIEPRPAGASPTPTVGWLELLPVRKLQRVPGLPSADHLTAGSWWLGHEPEHLRLAESQAALLGLFSNERCACKNVLYYHGRSRDRIYCQRYGLLCNPLILTGLQTDAWTILIADDQVQTDPTGLTPVLNEYLLNRIEKMERDIRNTQMRLAERSRGGFML